MNRKLPIILVLSTVAAAPIILSQSPDCQKWIATYRERIQHRIAAHHLRAVKRRLMQARRYPHRHAMGPLEALRRFTVDCGEMFPVPEALLPPQILPPLQVEVPGDLEWPAWLPPENPFPAPALVSELTPDAPGVPGVAAPFGPVFVGVPIGPGVPVSLPPYVAPVASTPESGTLWLVGLGCLGLTWKREELRG